MIGNICPAEDEVESGGGPTWPRGRDVTHPRFHFGPRHRHRSASSYLCRSCTVISIDFFLFFKSSLHLVHTRGPISSSIHCRFIHVIYGGRDIYIYERWDGKTVLGSKRWIIKSFSDFSRMDLDRSLDEIPKIAFLREGRISLLEGGWLFLDDAISIRFPYFWKYFKSRT